MVKKHLVFVYGSLLSGMYNHGILGQHSKLIGLGYAKGFKMYSLGSFPGIKKVEEVDDGNVIHGEVYEVDTKTLNRLDRLEGVPYLYTREVCDVVLSTGEVKERVSLYVYASKAERFPKVEGGDWRNYEGRNKNG